jgi:mannose-6-phosphate isomerase-like protein (cupin superfamily)
MTPGDFRERLVDALQDLVAALGERLPAPLRSQWLAASPVQRSAPACLTRTVPATGAPHRHPAVLRVMPRLRAPADLPCQRLLETVIGTADALDWRQTYRLPEVDARFLDNYAYAEILEPLTTPGVAAGLLLLGPDTHYPAHHHPADEVYVPLSGAAEWRQAESPWVRREPGAVIVHPSLAPHAMRTGSEPLLALYLWYGTGLEQPAQLLRGAA